MPEEEVAAAALLVAADVVGAAVVAGAALVGAGADVAVALEVPTVGACGCPSMVWVTGAMVVCSWTWPSVIWFAIGSMTLVWKPAWI